MNPPKTAILFKVHRQEATFCLRFLKLPLKFSSSNIKEVTDLVPLTVSDRQNGVNPPKTAILFTYTNRTPKLCLRFPKLPLKFSSSNIKEVIDLVNLTVSGRKTA